MEVLPSYVWGQQHPDPVFTPAAAARALLVFLLYGPGGSGGSHPDLPRHQMAGRPTEGQGVYPPDRRKPAHDTLKLHLIDPADVADVLPYGIGLSHRGKRRRSPLTQPLASPRTIMEQLTCPMGEDRSVDRRRRAGTPSTGPVTASGRRRGDPPEHDPYAVRWDTPPEDIEKTKGKTLAAIQASEGQRRAGSLGATSTTTDPSGSATPHP